MNAVRSQLNWSQGGNCGEFATIKSQAGLNNYKISVKEWVEKTNAMGLPPNQRMHPLLDP
jgi:hypothetical protein